MDPFDPKLVKALTEEFQRRAKRIEAETQQLEERARQDMRICDEWDAIRIRVAAIKERIEAGDLSAVDDLIVLKQRADALAEE